MSHHNETLAEKHKRLRPRWYRFDASGIFRTWPERPSVVVQYGKYYLKWEIGMSQRSWTREEVGAKYMSIDGVNWKPFKLWGYRANSHNPEDHKPAWLDPDELEAEIAKVKKAFMRKRANEQAKARRAALKKEAEEKGVSLEDLQSKKSKKRNERLTKQRNKRTAEKLTKQTNKKMQIAMALKDLRDQMAILQAKMENPEIDLLLHHVDSRIHKIHDAERIIKEWCSERE